MKKTCHVDRFRCFLSNQLVLGIALELLSTEYPNLTSIFLVDNRITNVGLLGFALRHNTTVTRLHLNSNEIKNVDSLALMLATNTTLKTVDLSENRYIRLQKRC